MQNAMIGWQNALPSAQIAIASGGTYAGFPPSNVALDVGGNGYAWRSGAGSPQAFTAAFATAVPVRAISLHRTNLSASATMRVILSLSGNFLVDTGDMPLNVSSGQGFLVLPSALTADKLYLAINDPGQTQPYYSVPFVYCGPVFQPVRNFTMDAGWGSAPQVDGFTTRNGLEFPQYRYRKRTLKLPWGNFLPAEMPTVEAIIAYTDTARNVLVIPQPDMLTGGLLPVFGQATASDRGLVQGGYRSTVLTVTERL